MLSNLKAALAARRMRQIDLAFALRLDPSTVSLIVTGRREADAALRGRIAEVLGIEDVEWLFRHVRIPAPRGPAPVSFDVGRAVGARS